MFQNIFRPWSYMSLAFPTPSNHYSFTRWAVKFSCWLHKSNSGIPLKPWVALVTDKTHSSNGAIQWITDHWDVHPMVPMYPFYCSREIPRFGWWNPPLWLVGSICNLYSNVGCNVVWLPIISKIVLVVTSQYIPIADGSIPFLGEIHILSWLNPHVWGKSHATAPERTMKRSSAWQPSWKIVSPGPWATG